MINRIRNAARAVIIAEGKLLTIKMSDPEHGVFYILPGGGQRPGEVLTDSLRRECREELGVEIDVMELLFMREYLGCNHTFSRRHKSFHQLEAVFRCRLADNGGKQTALLRDKKQVGIEWLAIDQLAACHFYPEYIKPFFHHGDIHVSARYLGDIN